MFRGHFLVFVAAVEKSSYCFLEIHAMKQIIIHHAVLVFIVVGVVVLGAVFVRAGEVGSRNTPVSVDRLAIPEGQEGMLMRNDIKLKLTIEGDAFRSGEAILYEVMIVNESEAPVVIWGSGFWPNHRVDVLDERGELAPITEAGAIRREVFAPRGLRDKNVEFEIEPGGSFQTGKGELLHLFELAPGRYSVNVTYEDTQEPTPLQLISADVEFVILP